MLWLEWVDALVVAQMVQLVLVLDAYFLLPSLFLLIVRGPGQSLKSSLLLYASIVYVPVLPSPAKV